METENVEESLVSFLSKRQIVLRRLGNTASNDGRNVMQLDANVKSLSA